MGKPKDKLEIEVMKLPPEDRAELAHRRMRDREFLPPAEEEMNEAARFYEQRSPGLNAHAADDRAQTW